MPTDITDRPATSPAGWLVGKARRADVQRHRRTLAMACEKPAMASKCSNGLSPSSY